jgi:hypothetical protein
MNDENTTNANLWDEPKALIRGIFIQTTNPVLKKKNDFK